MAALWHRMAVLGAALAVSAAVAAGAAAGGATTERIVGDWRTGLALHGFDPVAYFVESRALSGRADLEYSHGGMTWRFCNEGNLNAFKRDPDVYTPEFGGYDPLAVSRGVTTPGHPEFWLVFRNRLILFHSGENRAAFLTAAERVMALAESKWPEVVVRLTP